MKRTLVGGIVAGVVLMAPGIASAQVLSGATYTGAFTTGLPGSASIAVSEDGTTVDLNLDSFGPISGDCTSGLGRSDVAVSSGAFSVFESGPPLVTINGFFDSPGIVSGTARLSAGCDSGTQSFRAEAPIVWGDGHIGRVGDPSPRGDDVYNTSAAGQVRKWTAKEGQTRKFGVVAQNDGTLDGSLAVKGCGSSSAFKVSYMQGGRNETRDVVSGDYLTDELDPDESETLRLSIKPTRQARPGKVKSCKIRTAGQGQTDVVEAELKVKRG
jgi:hypothetical protein